MNERDALFANVLNDPADDTARLELADWLDDHDENDLARFLRAGVGAPKAITATAHKLSRLVYRMLKHGAEYVRVGLAEYEQKVKSQSERWLRKKAGLLGYELVSKTTE